MILNASQRQCVRLSEHRTCIATLGLLIATVLAELS